MGLRDKPGSFLRVIGVKLDEMGSLTDTSLYIVSITLIHNAESIVILLPLVVYISISLLLSVCLLLPVAVLLLVLKEWLLHPIAHRVIYQIINLIENRKTLGNIL